MMRYAQRERPAELTLEDMTKRLCVANFGSMHQTSIAVTNMIFNILGSDSEYNTILVLRDEVFKVIGDADGSTWTKANIAKIVRADSVCP